MRYEDDLYDIPPQGPLWRVEIRAGMRGDAAQALAETLEDLCQSWFLHNREATDGDLWDLHLTVEGAPDLPALRARLPLDAEIHAAPVEQKDWLLAVHQDFPPVTVGGFFVFGSHCEGEIPEGLIPLKIDAATAFGSGEHPTTQGCLLLLEDLKAEGFTPKRALDMGCGSGILAVAMKKLWPDAEIFAVDIDPESVTVTQRHAAMNGTTLAAAEAGDGYAAACVGKNAPFDLVAANILAGPLVAMAGDLARALAPGGVAVLSGLLSRQMDEVGAAHTALGLSPGPSRALGEWRALAFASRPGSAILEKA